MTPRRFAWLQALVLVLAVALAAAIVFRPAPGPPPSAPSAPRAAAGPSLIEARPPTAATPVDGASFPSVVPGAPFSFPRDHGAHPAWRLEWWYLTGWLETAGGAPLGFQVTFFRVRTGLGEGNPSAFAPRQVLFAHAALSDPRVGRLLHDQRIARQGFGLAQARLGDADLVLNDWSLVRRADGRFHARVRGEEFDLDLVLSPTQPPLLQGQGGYSRKGPSPTQASYYYSVPHLAVSGRVSRDGREREVTGQAWMDREWSSTLLDSRAVGWDWAGINLDDGSALTAFQVRDAEGRAVWAGGSLRGPDGALTTFAPDQVRLRPLRVWRSPRTGAAYPVAQQIEVDAPDGPRRFTLEPLFDDQELDSRAAGGPVYWEGAVATQGGRGYLELTGYASALKM
ncbi:MAG: lipocalin-like domain-containing protein [Phenylobacterium sp.]|uniref:lipocalin-like domain-containing protein n=1 Tax=Phenylobacterium sp. TaxID=1871053 RepID=UPI00391CC23A